jgi:hypothetical protein
VLMQDKHPTHLSKALEWITASSHYMKRNSWQ